jgi:hypothetical protein
VAPTTLLDTAWNIDMSCFFRHRALLMFAVGILYSGAVVAADNNANGMLFYKSRSATLKYAWLVKGPYSRDPSKTVRRLILSAQDISARLRGCKAITCADGQVTEGMTVDFDVGPRLDYWLALNGQKEQYSGTATPDAFSARANDTEHLAGRLAIDDVAAGGPKVDVEFNVTLFKEFGPDR